MSFRINYSIDSSSELKSGVIYGTFSISIDSHYFPEQHWTDFIVRVLGMWTYNLKELLNGRTTVDFPFMDGSYYFIARRIPQDKIQITCYADDVLVDNPIELDLQLFKKEILDTSKNILAMFFNQADHKDLLALKKGISDIKS